MARHAEQWAVQHRREGESGVDGGAVEFKAVREGVQVGQVGGADRGDPLGELGVVALRL
jgi:hypothetical protein